jgi:hypothetical protein
MDFTLDKWTRSCSCWASRASGCGSSSPLVGYSIAGHPKFEQVQKAVLGEVQPRSRERKAGWRRSGVTSSLPAPSGGLGQRTPGQQGIGSTAVCCREAAFQPRYILPPGHRSSQLQNGWPTRSETWLWARGQDRPLGPPGSQSQWIL